MFDKNLARLKRIFLQEKEKKLGNPFQIYFFSHVRFYASISPIQNQTAWYNQGCNAGCNRPISGLNLFHFTHMLWTTKYNYSVPHHNHLLCDLQHSKFQEPRCYRYPVCNGKIARLSPCVIFHCIVDDLHKGVRLESLSNFHVNLAVKVQVDTISDLTYQWIILKIIQIQSNFGPTDFGGWSYKFTPVCRRSFRQSL